MAMTKKEVATIRNLIKRLQKPNCGCTNGPFTEIVVSQANGNKIEAVSRIYLDTWVIGALIHLLPEHRNPELAERLSK